MFIHFFDINNNYYDDYYYLGVALFCILLFSKHTHAMAAFLEDTVSELPAEDGIYTDSVNDQIDDRVSDNINVSLPAEANAESMMRPSQLAGLTSMQNIQIPQNFIPQIPADINATSSMPDLTILARLTDIRLLDRILRLGSTNRVHPLQEPQQQHHEQHELEEEAEEQPNQAERFSQHPSQVVHNIEDTSFNIDDDLTEPLIPQSRDDEVQQLGHVQQQHDQEHVSEAQSTRDVEMNNNEDQERANVEEHLQGLRQNTNPLKEKLIYRYMSEKGGAGWFAMILYFAIETSSTLSISL